jgi:hypothetical protein
MLNILFFSKVLAIGLASSTFETVFNDICLFKFVKNAGSKFSKGISVHFIASVSYGCALLLVVHTLNMISVSCAEQQLLSETSKQLMDEKSFNSISR